jgi:hypothetical protein
MRWLRRLLGRKDSAGYVRADREVFPFWDGRRQRLADPLAVHRALLTNPNFDAKLDPQIAAVPTVDGLKAMGRLAAAVRLAFGVADISGGGLTDAECMALYIAFGNYIGRLTEEYRPLASSPGPTASATGGSVTPTSAASGSTASA